MKRLFKRGGSNLYLYVVTLLLVGMTWRGGEYVQLRMAELEVKEAPKVHMPSAPIDQKNFYPVWLKQPSAQIKSQGDAEVDALFMKPAEPKQEIKPVEPDYVAMFQQSATVDGVADNGVYVNGTFYKVGDKLQDLSIAAIGGAAVVPVVEAIKDGKVVFRVGPKHVSFIYGQRK